MKNWPAVFRGFCLEGESVVRWPVAIFQPLNFEEHDTVRYLTKDNVIDDRMKLSFHATVCDQEKLELTEIVER